MSKSTARSNYNTTPEALAKNRRNKPTNTEEFNLIRNTYARSITRAKASTLFKLLPYLPEDKQSLRGVALILGVSHETVRNWIRDFSHEEIFGIRGEK